MKKRLLKFDAVQGLVRNAQYLKDYDEICGGLLKPKRFYLPAVDFLCKKYQLQFALDPDVWIKKTPEEVGSVVIFDETVETPPVEVIHPEKEFSEPIPVEDPEAKKKACSHAPPETPDGDIVFARIDSVKNPKRFLFCRVDLSAPKKLLLAEVERIIDRYGKSVDRPKERNRPEQVDKFLVWDDYKKTGSIIETARNLKLSEEATRKAFHRADEIITKIVGEGEDGPPEE